MKTIKIVILTLLLFGGVFAASGDNNSILRESKTGDKVTLNVQSMDIVQVIKLLAKKMDLSVVLGGNIRGRVTLFLEDVDVWEAIKIVLSSNDLAYVKKGKILNIMPINAYRKLYGKNFYEQTKVKVFPILYAKASDLVAPLNLIKSSLGKVIVEAKSNTIIITDTESQLEQLSSIIKELDKKQKQVLIEAKIMQIVLNKSLSMGVDWQSLFNSVNSKNVSGSISASLGGTGAGINLSLGTLTQNNYQALIHLLKTKGKTNFLSTPRILVMNNEKANILVGTKEAYVTTTVLEPSSAGASTRYQDDVKFEKVGIKLSVTPTISADGFVVMEISPEVSSVESVIETKQGGKVPIVRTSETTTKVMVKNGRTIVIAGLIEEKKEQSSQRVPILGDIPILGSLFGSTNNRNVKTELAIFLTPTIVTGDVSDEVELKKNK